MDWASLASRMNRHARLGLPLVLLLCVGCTSPRQYWENGLKVGPNYCRPAAKVEQQWIDATDIRTAENPEIVRRWWTVFNDATLCELVSAAYRQNLTLREAGCRILQARAYRDFAVGNLFPQNQEVTGSYDRIATAANTNGGGLAADRFRDSWNLGFNLNWELDFWGRFRRAVASAEASLDASVEEYDAVLVTLVADVAENYVTMRTAQERIALLQANVELQRGVLEFIERRLNAGFKQTELDVDQALATLRQTESGIPALEIVRRQAENRLCILMGMPPENLAQTLGTGAIPVCPADVVVNIPADLLRRRPDVRKAERQAAAQAEQIGIAESDLYPAIFVSGSLGYSAQNFADLFRSNAFNGSVGPNFQWNVLNYGRIVSNVRFQDAKFVEFVVHYQNLVLQASAEVEDGLVTFLQSQRRAKLSGESVEANQKAVKIALVQYENGAVDFNRYATIEQNLVVQQDLAAQARGQIAQGLITVFRALGGGWEIRLPDGAAPGTSR